MTGSQETFNARADSAASALKGTMNLPSKTVAVGPDGQPAKPLPPMGSYLRSQIEQRQQLAQDEQAARSSSPPQNIHPSNGEAVNGTTETAEHEAQEGELSPNAMRRFSELTGQLRERERALGEAVQRTRAQDEEIARVRSEIDAIRQANERLQQEHRKILDQTLDGLDPETRATVLMESKIAELLAEQERRIASRFETQLKSLRERTEEDDYAKLRKYRNFDIQVHKPLIEMFRTQNPACSVEQAYKAVAEPGELTIQGSPIAPSVPPVLEPGKGPTAEHMVPRPKQDPNQKMVEDARRVKELMSSSNPADHKEGIRLAERNIKERLSGRF